MPNIDIFDTETSYVVRIIGCGMVCVLTFYSTIYRILITPHLAVIYGTIIGNFERIRQSFAFVIFIAFVSIRALIMHIHI